MTVATSPDDGVNLIGIAAHKALRLAGVDPARIRFDYHERPFPAIGDFADGTADVLIHEAIMTPHWQRITAKRPVRYLPWGEAVLTAFAAEGWPSATVDAGYLPGLDEDLRTLDFSDFVLLCRQDLADDVAYLAAWCMVKTRRALEAQYAHLPRDHSPVTYPSSPPTSPGRRSRCTRRRPAPSPTAATTRSATRPSGADHSWRTSSPASASTSSTAPASIPARRLHLRGRAEALHQPGRVHRLRRLPPRVPGRRDHRAGRVAGPGVEADNAAFFTATLPGRDTPLGSPGGASGTGPAGRRYAAGCGLGQGITADVPLLVVGGGIGGLAAALAVARAGFTAHVVERSAEFGEIGAGIQLAPNALRVLDGLGVLPELAVLGVHPGHLVFMHADTGRISPRWTSASRSSGVTATRTPSCTAVTCSPCCTRPAGRMTASPWKAGREVTALADRGGAAEVGFADGGGYECGAVVGADGLWSTARKLVAHDRPRTDACVAYRGTLAASDMALLVSEDSTPAEPDDEIIWIAPHKHLVQYPIRPGELYNQVAVFRSRRYSAGAELTGNWGTPAELDDSYARACAQVRAGVAVISRDRRW